MENVAQEALATITSVVSYPAAETKTGTVSSAATTVAGAGTDFLTELCYVGDFTNVKYPYIFNPATGEIREIVNVVNSTTLIIKNAFSIPMAAQALKVISTLALYRSLSINGQSGTVKICTVGAAPVTMDNNAIENLERVDAWLQPIGIDASAGQCQVTAIR